MLVQYNKPRKNLAVKNLVLMDVLDWDHNFVGRFATREWWILPKCGKESCKEMARETREAKWESSWE